MKHEQHEHAEHMECACELNGSGHDHTHDGHDHEADGCACGHEHTHSKEEPKTYLLRIIVGTAIFALGIILQNTVDLPEWARFAVFFAAYLILGINVLAAAGKNILKGKVFDENFLMTVATIGAFILTDYAEGTAVMLFYLIGETLSDIAVDRSKKSITKLMDIRPDYANLKQGDDVKRVDPQSVKIGDVIVVKPFEKIPLDGVIQTGASALNTSALTGESMPREVAEGDAALAGSVNGGGLLEIRVAKEFGESTVAKILDLVENAGSKKAHTEKFITKFARYYTPIVCAGALIVAVVPSLVTGDWATWVYRALLFLVISCPCALVVSVPLTYFSGIGGASKKGILIKGANYLEALTEVSEVVFDKTGTLTKGEFAVKKVFAADGVSEEGVLANAASAELNSSHPIARSVLAAYGKEAPALENYSEEAGYGVRAITDGGQEVLAGNAKLMERSGISFTEVNEVGTVLYVARGGKFLGSILIADQIKQDARETASALRSMGVGTAMLTGDAKRIGETVAADIGIDEVYTELLPQDKVSVLEKIQQKKGRAAFVGDGINDAPVLARSDVGIAMGGAGSDAAIEAADVVLMTDEPSKVAESIRLSRRTRRIVWQNIIFALAVKAAVMVLGVTGIADMWWAVFADVGVTLIAVVNALRAMK
ncbi:MAG: heavy metal translocating P-type ATPase [Christensenella sp.]|uniref:heavy metal translocating P-type ATPase n=1 Tax=Christensenella sp. TaxID=1935934 RepID=UPI002B1ED955|nr:heavy metal translocating P-type ATPase [Christensenella sp.]MEA5004624.1 heavy metal translocating P-type ATPase [Christensenella sp.]